MFNIKDLSKIYNSKNKEEVKALDNINLSFDNQGLVFILGPSGCGKTTLLNLLGGIDIPTSGIIELNGNKISNTEEGLDIYRNLYIGFVFQDFNLIDNMSIFDNLSLVCFDIPEDERREKISCYLNKVGLKGYEKRYPKELSGGQIQRVAIARALLKDSLVLLADEPTGNLNHAMSIGIFDLFKEISKEKLVIVVSHNEELANNYADRIIKLRDGNIIEDNVINIVENKKVELFREPKNINKRQINNMVKQSLLSNKFDIIIYF